MSNEVVTYYWSRAPGKVVNKITGAAPTNNFELNYITVQDWYHTLLHVITDIWDQNKNINRIETSKDVYTIIDCMVMFKSESVKSYKGVLNNKFDVSVNSELPHFEIQLFADSEVAGKIIVTDMNIIE